MERLRNMFTFKMHEELHRLENRRHYLNFKIRKLVDTYSYVCCGVGVKEVNALCREKTEVVKQIRKIRTKLMRVK